MHVKKEVMETSSPTVLSLGLPTIQFVCSFIFHIKRLGIRHRVPKCIFHIFVSTLACHVTYFTVPQELLHFGTLAEAIESPCTVLSRSR